MMASERAAAEPAARPAKLHGRAFYESIGSPKIIVAPMVDQSEFAWRMLSRSFFPESERPSLLAYSPMLHARLFADTQKYRDTHFQPLKPPPSADPSSNKKPTKKPPSNGASTTTTTITTEPFVGTEPYLDGNPKIDRPLFVQFCANDPAALLSAATLVAPHCDAVDLNLGCPQGIARKGHYGAFLQEDQELICNLIHTLHTNLAVPVTAKIRILETKEATLDYAKRVLAAGASILTVHGRRREQKGHLTGVADWGYIRYLRDNLPPETVIFANGNILQQGDVEKCLEATGADGVMSAEGNLSDPGVFAPVPPPGEEGREYWRGRDGRGGWRVDAVMRRYLDILHTYVLGKEAPVRKPLFVPGDDEEWLKVQPEVVAPEPVKKKRKRDASGNGMTSATAGPNLMAVQPHLFHLLRHFVTKHTDVRDTLAKSRLGDISMNEKVLEMVERKVAEGILEYERTDGKSFEDDGVNGAYEVKPKDTTKGAEAVSTPVALDVQAEAGAEVENDPQSSVHTVKKCKRPWWVVQPIVRPLPAEALARGAIQMRTKGMPKVDEAAKKKEENTKEAEASQDLEKTTSFPDSNLVSG